MTKQVPFVPNCYSRKGIKVEMLLPVVASTKKSQHKEALPKYCCDHKGIWSKLLSSAIGPKI